MEQFFKSLRDEVGGFIFAKEMNENGTLVGYPYKTTNLLETTGGKTQIVFGNWNDLVIGEQGALEIETSRECSWTDDAGNLVPLSRTTRPSAVLSTTWTPACVTTRALPWLLRSPSLCNV